MMKRVMLVEDEEFILQGILCIVDWPSINMELAYTAHNGMEALEKAGKKLDDMDRKQAANMEPDNQEYQSLVQQLQSGGRWYQQQGQQYNRSGIDLNTLCCSICALNMCCGGYGRFFCC